MFNASQPMMIKQDYMMTLALMPAQLVLTRY